jgi:hypothetical protein
VHRESKKLATDFGSAVAKAVRKVDRGLARRADSSRWPNADKLVYVPDENLDRETFALRAAEKGVTGQWTPEGFEFLPPLAWGNTEHRRVGCDLLAIFLEVSGFEVKVMKNDQETSPE